MVDYVKSEATAQRLIAKFGQRAYLSKAGDITGTAYNPTFGPTTDWPITVVDISERVRDRDGTLVESAGHSLIVSTEGLDLVTLTKGDSIYIGASGYPETMTAFEIAEVRPLNPGGTVILHEVDLVR